MMQLYKFNEAICKDGCAKWRALQTEVLQFEVLSVVELNPKFWRTQLNQEFLTEHLRLQSTSQGHKSDVPILSRVYIYTEKL